MDNGRDSDLFGANATRGHFLLVPSQPGDNAELGMLQRCGVWNGTINIIAVTQVVDIVNLIFYLSVSMK